MCKSKSFTIQFAETLGSQYFKGGMSWHNSFQVFKIQAIEHNKQYP